MRDRSLDEPAGRQKEDLGGEVARHALVDEDDAFEPGRHIHRVESQGGVALQGPAEIVADGGDAVEELQSMLSLYGYDVQITGIFDSGTASVVEAFQRHFRPRRVDGVADRSTVETLRRLLRSLPDAFG